MNISVQCIRLGHSVFIFYKWVLHVTYNQCKVCRILFCFSFLSYRTHGSQNMVVNGVWLAGHGEGPACGAVAVDGAACPWAAGAAGDSCRGAGSWGNKKGSKNGINGMVVCCPFQSWMWSGNISMPNLRTLPPDIFREMPGKRHSKDTDNTSLRWNTQGSGLEQLFEHSPSRLVTPWPGAAALALLGVYYVCTI